MGLCHNEDILTPHGPLTRENNPSYPHSGLSQNLLSMCMLSKIVSIAYTLLQLSTIMTCNFKAEWSGWDNVISTLYSGGIIFTKKTLHTIF